MTETLDDLLNKTEALVRCGEGTFTELAKAIGKPAQSVYDWLGQRRFKPNGDTALKIREWAAKKSGQIAIGPRATQTKYRQAYRDVCEKRRSRQREEVEL